MDDFLEKHNIDVPYFAKKCEPEKLVESQKHSHNAQSQGNKNYALSTGVKYFTKLSYIDSFYDIYESHIY